jgi:diacylglycerol kinase family enzyme
VKVVLVVNPRSAAGATGRRIPEIEAAAAAVFDDWRIARTTRPGEASDLAAAAAAEGADVVVAVGGDGTANEVVNGLFDGTTLRRRETAFAILPAGTGSDLVKTLRMPRDIAQSLRVIADASPRPVDAVAVGMVGHAGEPVKRIGINVTGFGANGEVVRRANRSSKRLGGRLTFLKATVETLLTWAPTPTRVTWVDGDGKSGSWEGVLTSGFIANGAYCGGGIWIGRGGAIDDGLLDLVLVPQLGPIRTIVSSPRLFSGTMDHVKDVSRIAVRSLEAATTDGRQMLVDVDGEQPGVLPLNAQILPKALLVRALF